MTVESDDSGNVRDQTRAAIARGLTLAVFIYLGTKIGLRGFFNPTVSFCMMIIGRMSGKNCILHIFVQLLSALLAASTCFLLRPPPSDEYKIRGYAKLNTKVGVFSALMIEIISSFIFVLTIFMSRVNRKTSPIYAAAICGSSAILAKFAFGEVTGGVVNPMRGFAPALIDANIFHRGWWVFWIGGVIGSLLAAYVSHIYLEERDPKKYLKNMEAGFARDALKKKKPQPQPQVLETDGTAKPQLKKLPSVEHSIDIREKLDPTPRRFNNPQL